MNNESSTPIAASAARSGAAADWPLVIEDHLYARPSDSSSELGVVEIPFSIPYGPIDPDTQKPRVLKAMISMSLGVDDWGSMSIEGNGRQYGLIDLMKSKDNPAGEHGGHAYQTGASNAELESGDYTLRVEQRNIDMDNPADNASICDYRMEGNLIEPGGVKKPACPCCSTEGGDEGGEPSTEPLNAAARGRAPFADSPGDSWRTRSAGGSNARAVSTENAMFWQVTFGSFRGMGGIPQGTLELMAQGSLEGYESPSRLQFSHPLASRVSLPEGGLVLGSRCEVRQGSESMAVVCGSNRLDPVGVFTGSDNKMEWADGQNGLVRKAADGSVCSYDAHTGRLASYTSPLGRTLTAADIEKYLVVVRDAQGALRQIWNYWDGLMNIENVTSGGYDIAFYTAGQVAGRGSGGLYIVEGEPFKKFKIAKTYFKDELFITESAPGRAPYQTRWNVDEGGTLMVQGYGDEAVCTRRASVDVGDGVTWSTIEIRRGEKTTRADQTILETYRQGALGPLLLSRREGTPDGAVQTTRYAYDAKGRKTREDRPDGSVWEWEYDDYGRETLRREPWSGGACREIRTSYREEVTGDIAETSTLLYKNAETSVEWTKSVYSYPEQEHVKRVEKRTTALGSAEERLEITETWLATVPNPYARGRMKMQRREDGVETHYRYEATEAYGALYTVAAETRVNGEIVAGHSTRQIRYVTVEGNAVREESWHCLSDGSWAMTDAADYAFDVQNRWNKRTRANGRVHERAVMCDGRLLWEKNEDGILTSYGYDSARQLTETIRSAVTDGDAVVTPETITSYTRDGLGRATTTRTDAGPLKTSVHTAYDALGRVLAETDAQNRQTIYSYSGDGLKVTATRASGAKLIEQHHADGAVLRRYGSGQRDVAYETDLAVDGIRVTTTVAREQGDPPAGEEMPRVITGRTITDGFGQTLRVVTAHTMDDGNYRYFTWNALGQLVREQWENMAPTLYDYDLFGNKTQETVVLDESAPPTPLNARITRYAYAKERREDGVYGIVTATTYTETGAPVVTSEAKLISNLSPTLEDKTVSADARGQTSASWVEYGEGAARLSKQTVPGAAAAAVARLVDNFETGRTDAAGIVTLRQTRFWTAAGVTLRQTDSRGNVTTTETDPTGRVLQVTDAAGNATRYAYAHPHDEPASVTDAMGHTAHYAYDPRGRKIAEWGTGIHPVVYAYDDADNPVSLTTFRASEETVATDPRDRTDGDVTTWAYDRATGLPTQKTYADGTRETVAYDALNRVATVVNARGQAATRHYDPRTGELTGIVFANDTSPSQSYRYNYLGQLVGIVDGSGERVFVYNEYNELAGETRTGEVEAALAETRDAAGRPAGYALVCNGSTVQTTAWNYDETGRLKTVTLNELAKPFQYDYDSQNGLLETVSYPNPLARQTQYEAQRDLVAQLAYKRPGSVNDPAKVEYAYDLLGRPTERKDYFNTATPGLTRAYAYNDRSELASETLSQGGTNAYAYDNIGNRTCAQEGDSAAPTTYATNALNQYAFIQASGDDETEAFAPTYDASGNQTRVKTATGIWKVAYNAENRPVRFASEDGQTTIDCTYDSQGRRWEKQVAQNGLVVSRTLYLYRGYLLIAELDALNASATTPATLRKTYLWDPLEEVATRVLAMTTYDEAGNYEEDLFYTHDALKNTTALFGIIGGRRASYSYGAYGQTLAMEGNAAASNPFRFSSEYADEELGLIYYNYRHYNPLDGRWISRDPIGEMGGINIYAFMGNKLNCFIDELGLSPSYPNCCGQESDKVLERAKSIKYLQNKLNRQLDEVIPRIRDVQANPRNLPQTHPDDIKHPRLSVRGHQRLINDRIKAINRSRTNIAEQSRQLDRLEKILDECLANMDPRCYICAKEPVSVVEKAPTIEESLLKGLLIAIEFTIVFLSAGRLKPISIKYPTFPIRTIPQPI